jgi:hypothetical protein
MKRHEEIFLKTKELLKQQMGLEIIEYDDGNCFAVGESNIWMGVMEDNIMVGYGAMHNHYYPEDDNLEDAVESFFNLLTKPKQVTLYFKGEFEYKQKAELVIGELEHKSLGSAMTWLFPFWKKTKKKIIMEGPIIDGVKIEKEIEEIRKIARK